MSRFNVTARPVKALAALVFVVGVQSCAPQATYRRPLPPPSAKPRPAAPPAPALPPAVPETPKPLPQEARIREQDLQPPEKAIPPITIPEEPPPPVATPEVLPPAPPTPLADDSSLLAKIGPSTPPQRAASLRLAEEGRKLLESGDHARALNRLERAISIDSTNAYGHFLLAKTQHGLKRYKESLNFLEVAEFRLRDEPFWLAEVYALRGENFRALGMFDQAAASYQQALSINSGNRTAAEALSRIDAESQPAQR